jgi:hypothetical protein
MWEMIAKNVEKIVNKRYLDKRSVPLEMMHLTPFSDPDHYDIFIGGRRCDIQVILITDKRRIRSIRAEPNLLLKT